MPPTTRPSDALRRLTRWCKHSMIEGNNWGSPKQSWPDKLISPQKQCAVSSASTRQTPQSRRLSRWPTRWIWTSCPDRDEHRCPNATPLRNQLGRVDVRRAHDGEIASVQCCDSRNAEPFCDCDDRGVNCSESQSSTSAMRRDGQLTSTTKQARALAVAGLVTIRGRDEDAGVNEHFDSDAFSELPRRELGAFLVNLKGLGPTRRSR